MHMFTRKTPRSLKSAVALTSVLATGALILAGCTSAPSGETAGTAVSLQHYFSGASGEKSFDEIIPLCEEESGQTITNSPTTQEAFKSAILVQLAGGNAPDVFTYWAGAKTASVVDRDLLAPLDDFWAENDLDATMPPGMVQSASTYDGSKYLVPFSYHFAGMFYNPKVMAAAGITTMPTTWDELIDAAVTLKANGVTPFALGSKDAWPAQFWFDYILLRTAGPEYRAQLMNGEASYSDEEVVTAFGMWKELFDKDLFNASPNGITWSDAANLVSNGEAAMTLMGSWITGYWDNNGVVAVEDYDMFPFPEITPGVEQAAVGPVDGWVVPASTKNLEGAEAVLACLASAEVQQLNAMTQGGLAPNTQADLSERNDVIKKAAENVNTASSFAFNYDLATPPEVSSEGLNFLAQFVDTRDGYEERLEQLQQQVAPLFKK